MATVTPPRSTWNREDNQRRVIHPLHRLRGYIRAYVSAEGLAVLLIYLALWFWIGMLLDYGFFKLFTIDWVQELPHTFRVVVLCVLSAGLLAMVALKVVLRLVREFRDSALALVLERRFPHQLGDRLITAVEMADPRLADKYGFSQAMLEQTAQDAADRVSELPVNEVFDWKRLRNYGLAVAGFTLGLYLLVGIGAFALRGGEGNHLGAGFNDVNDVAMIWFERNILLVDTIWPRKCHLELVDFPGNVLHVGHGQVPPPIRVRALKWVIAEKDRKKAPEGWRALNWTDLHTLGVTLPTDLQGEDGMPEEWRSASMDQVELQLDKPEGGGSLPADKVIALRGVFEQLDVLAASPSMSRHFRKLLIPQDVTLTYKGGSSRNDQSLQKQSDNLYSGTLPALKESVRFNVRAEDYYTPSRRIQVVPPPSLIELGGDEAQPAYLYHQIPVQGTKDDLKNRKQKFATKTYSVSNNPTSIGVPAGTDVVLTAKTNKPLHDKGVRVLPPKEGAAAVPAPDIDQVDEQTFRLRFDNVTAAIEMDFELTDTTNVHGRHRLAITPAKDPPPEVNVQVSEVIRKTSNGQYMVTPSALVPFAGEVTDLWGIASVDYAYTLNKIESPGDQRARVALVASALPQLMQRYLGAKVAGLSMLQPLVQQAAAGAEEKPETMPLLTFARILKRRAEDNVPRQTLLEKLDQSIQKQLLKDQVILDGETEIFSMERLGLKVTDEKAIQPHYRLRIGVTAADNNIETGPGIGQNKEKFTFLVVSENELLAEIGKEEEALHFKLEEAVTRLKDGRVKLENVLKELPELKKPDELSPVALRSIEVQEAIAKAASAAKDIHTDYRRILRELQANQVQQGMISKVQDKICVPLSDLLRQASPQGEFGRSDETITKFKEQLEKATKAKELSQEEKDRHGRNGTQAKEELDRLIERLESVLDVMADLMTIKNLIDKLLVIQKAEEEEAEKLADLKKKIEDEIFGNLEKPKKKDN